MPVLNSHSDLPSNLRSAFGKPPQKTTFSPGERFCRLVTRGMNTLESPWWIREREMLRMERHAQLGGLALHEVVRPGLAVREDWNPSMDFLVTVQLLCSAIGWSGPARHQNAADKGTLSRVAFLGGKEQVYLPNLLCDNRFTSPTERREHRGLPTPRAVVTSYRDLRRSRDG